jgi:hypothetical protein
VKVTDPAGLAAYTMDSHNLQRLVVNGMVKNEGDVQIGGFPPYDISYRALIPRKEECSNLIVPVCLSSSHIAYGSIRMEPVFMVLGESAGIAASIAIDHNLAVQDIPVQELLNKLKTDPLLDGTPADILIDNSDSASVHLSGKWVIKPQQSAGRSYHDGFDLSDSGTAEYHFILQDQGNVRIYYYCSDIPEESGTQTISNALSYSVQVNGKEIESGKIPFKSYASKWFCLADLTARLKDSISVRLGDNNQEGIFSSDAVLIHYYKHQ